MKDSDALWTLDELTAEVESALAEGYEGSANGRVRDIPDRRTIRYYTTLGLIDRPSAMRGRTALYGRRHLLQLVAIKKLQARGRTLAEIQQDLMGQPIAELARVAGQSATDEEGLGPPSARRDFWREEPAAHAPSSASVEAPPSGPSVAGDQPLALCGIPLYPGVTLLLAPLRTLEAHDLEAIRSAAIPLIRTLTSSRLVDPPEGGELT
jgi:DNA-binding transcriptional MerR regulator